MKKKQTLHPVKKTMTFAEIMTKHPEAAEILMEKGMHCIGCAMSFGETLEQGAMVHGLDVDELLKEINAKINKKQKSKKKK